MSEAIDSFVDAAIADITETAAPAPEPEAIETPEGDAPEPEATETPTDDVAFPKKAVNAISRRDKKIGKQQAEISFLKEKLQSLEKAVTVNKAASPLPKEEDFDTYGEFLAATAKHAAREERTEAEAKATEAQREETSKQLESATATLEEARKEVVTESGREAQAVFPDFQDVVDSVSVEINGRLMLNLSPNARDAFLEAGEDAAFALYSLAKEGTLDDLNDLSLARAAMVISKHVDKGRALAKAKTTTNAPAPVARASGSGRGGKHPTQMTAAEVVAWVNS